MTLIDLSKYRLAKAAETLETAKRDMHAEDYASANNRVYYCIFHAMRAVLLLMARITRSTLPSLHDSL